MCITTTADHLLLTFLTSTLSRIGVASGTAYLGTSSLGTPCSIEPSSNLGFMCLTWHFCNFSSRSLTFTMVLPYFPTTSTGCHNWVLSKNFLTHILSPTTLRAITNDFNNWPCMRIAGVTPVLLCRAFLYCSKKRSTAVWRSVRIPTALTWSFEALKKSLGSPVRSQMIRRNSHMAASNCR